MIRFSLPNSPSLQRLARLHLACDPTSLALACVSLRCSPSAIQACASNGRLLASLILTPDDYQGEAEEVLIAGDQFAAAVKAANKAKGGSIQFEIAAEKARISRGSEVCLVPRVRATFPDVSGPMQSLERCVWIPSLACLDPNEAVLAQKISGDKQSLLFASPMPVSTELERLWDRQEAPGTVSLQDLRSATRARSYWADHELAFVIAPTHRFDRPAYDVSRHASWIAETNPIA